MMKGRVQVPLSSQPLPYSCLQHVITKFSENLLSISLLIPIFYITS